jgi:hypothetical protein
MTTNSSNSPDRPAQQTTYRPITFDDLQKPASASSQDVAASLLAPVPRWAAAPFFGFICFYTQRMPFLAPLLVLILLSCLLARLEEHARKIAAVPMTLSAIKLSFAMANETAYDFWIPSGATHRADDACFYWLPLFFSICLVFIPKRESATFRIVLVASCLLLSSGLLPGSGFIGIFYMIDYTLFIAIVVGIFVDLKSYASAQPQPSPRPAL